MNSPASQRDIVIKHREKDYALGTWGNFVIVVWFDNTTLDGVTRLEKLVEEMYKSHPEGVGLLTIVREHAKMPAADVRQRLAKFLASGAGKILVSSVVQEGKGFRAAAVRGFISGVTMLAKQPFPHKIFGTTEAAGEWMEETAEENTDWQLSKSSVAKAAHEFVGNAINA